MKLKRYCCRITLVLMLCVFAFSFAAVYADNELEPNFQQNGVNFYLSAPDTLTIEMEILGTHNITLHDGIATTVEWEYDVPPETLVEFSSSVSYLGATFGRSIDIVVLSQLVLTYSRPAFESGQQFLTGELIQQITARESLVSTFPVYTQYTFEQVENVVSQMQSDNFESINEGSMQISFPLPISEFTQELENGNAPSYLAEHYEDIELITEYVQDIELSPDFIVMIIQLIEDLPTEMPEEIPTVTLEPTIQAEVEEFVEQAEVIIEETIPLPSTTEVVVSALSAAVAAGAAGAAASVASGAAGASGGVGGASVAGLQQVAQAVATAGGVGGAALSFLKDIVTGLRDMFMDEGRAHASGKMRENLNKFKKK